MSTVLVRAFATNGGGSRSGSLLGGWRLLFFSVCTSPLTLRPFFFSSSFPSNNDDDDNDKNYHNNSFHIPGMSKEMLDAAESTRRSEQALVGVSMESAPNYPLLADKDFLAHFDLLATLSPPEEGDGAGSSPPQTPRRVWYPYYDDMFRRCWEAEGNPAAAILSSLSPAEGAAGGAAASAGVTTTANPSKPSLHPSYLRENAIAYVNSNCATKTGRDELVKAMAEVLEPLGIPLR